MLKHKFGHGYEEDKLIAYYKDQFSELKKLKDKVIRDEVPKEVYYAKRKELRINSDRDLYGLSSDGSKECSLISGQNVYKAVAIALAIPYVIFFGGLFIWLATNNA